MDLNTKRTRDATHLPDNSLDKKKPADKLVKLESCVKCKNAVLDDCIECNWCSHWDSKVANYIAMQGLTQHSKSILRS